VALGRIDFEDVALALAEAVSGAVERLRQIGVEVLRANRERGS
jgi:hypothetical protein